MNAPDRFEKFVVPENLQKVEYQKDTKLKNAGTFIIQREDHTVGNILRMKLLEDDRVLFAGYKLPHPLQYSMVVKVQTKGTVTPVEAVEDAFQALADEFADIEQKFTAAASQAQALEPPTDRQQYPY